MRLTLTRKTFTDESTAGDLSINGQWACFTLEDVARPAGAPKVHGKTAIPTGIYEVIINFSNRFRKRLPLLLNVPGFEGIRIHPGNKSDDTEGCILVGNSQGLNFIGGSRAAFAILFQRLDEAISRGERVSIDVRNA